MSTEIFLVGLIVFCIVALIFAINRWPEFFKSNDDDDTPFYPMI